MPTYKCSECKFDTKSLPLLIEHTRAHTAPHRAVSSPAAAPLFYKCKHCGFSTRQHYLLKLHIQSHIQIEAKKNQEALEENQTTEQQNSKVMQEKYEVPIQNKNEKYQVQNRNEKPEGIVKKTEERHVIKKMGLKKIHRCPECHYETHSSSTFWAHLLTHPNYYFKKVVPSLDEKNHEKRIVFIGRTSGALPWKKMFKCELCHFTGSNHQDFMNHVLVHVTEAKKKKIVPDGTNEQCVVETIHYCELCDFRTLSLEELKDHIEVHMQG